MVMRIVKVVPEWYEHASNSPRLQIVVDELPTRDILRYLLHRDEGGISAMAVYEGYVSFFHHSGRVDTLQRDKRAIVYKNDGGFGGTLFDVTDLNGQRHHFVGPWSSRPGIMNKWFRPLCENVTFTEEGRPGLLAGSATLPYFLAACKIANVVPLWEIWHNELSFEFTSGMYDYKLKDPYSSRTDRKWGYIFKQDHDVYSDLGTPFELPPQLRGDWYVPLQLAEDIIPDQ